jgi:hypothetical protein
MRKLRRTQLLPEAAHRTPGRVVWHHGEDRDSGSRFKGVLLTLTTPIEALESNLRSTPALHQ